jgi:hypothetical protein
MPEQTRPHCAHKQKTGRAFDHVRGQLPPPPVYVQSGYLRCILLTPEGRARSSLFLNSPDAGESLCVAIMMVTTRRSPPRQHGAAGVIGESSRSGRPGYPTRPAGLFAGNR